MSQASLPSVTAQMTFKEFSYNWKFQGFMSENGVQQRIWGEDVFWLDMSLMSKIVQAHQNPAYGRVQTNKKQRGRWAAVLVAEPVVSEANEE